MLLPQTTRHTHSRSARTGAYATAAPANAAASRATKAMLANEVRGHVRDTGLGLSDTYCCYQLRAPTSALDMESVSA